MTMPLHVGDSCQRLMLFRMKKYIVDSKRHDNFMSEHELGLDIESIKLEYENTRYGTQYYLEATM